MNADEYVPSYQELLDTIADQKADIARLKERVAQLEGHLADHDCVLIDDLHGGGVVTVRAEDLHVAVLHAMLALKDDDDSTAEENAALERCRRVLKRAATRA